MTGFYEANWKIINYSPGPDGIGATVNRQGVEKRLSEISILEQREVHNSVYLLPEAKTRVEVSSLSDYTTLRIKSSREVVGYEGEGLEEDLLSMLIDFDARVEWVTQSVNLSDSKNEVPGHKLE